MENNAITFKEMNKEVSLMGIEVAFDIVNIRVLDNINESYDTRCFIAYNYYVKRLAKST